MNRLTPFRSAGFAYAFAPLALLASLTLAGCPDDAKRPIGGNCDVDSDCVSGICSGAKCLDPDADEDGDGITNGIEAELGSNPDDADTDGDAIPDGEEIDVVVNVDTDGDGMADIIESATLDADNDCIPDQYDARNTTPDSDLSPMIAVVCSDVGVCQGQRGVMQVECSTGTARCVYGAVAGYVDPETACDGIDQNCDGKVDEAFPDRDNDGDADCVDVDWDNDDAADTVDNCPDASNPEQSDGDGDGIGNACASDYELVFNESPDEVEAGGAFSVAVGLAPKNDSGAPVPKFKGTVTVALAEAGTTLAGTLSQKANAEGVAVFDDLVVDSAAQGLVLTATSGDLGVGRSPPFDSVASVPTQFTFDELPTSFVAGISFGFDLVARDANGNVIEDFVGTVRFGASDADARLPADYTFTLADAGRHPFGGVAFETAGAQTLTASSDDFSSDADIDVVAAAFEALRMTLAPEVVAGAELDFTVSARDAFGNVIGDYDETLTITSTDPLADVPAPLTSTNGIYQGTITGGTAGNHTLTATAGADSATAPYLVRAGTATSLELTAPTSIGASIAFAAVVTARDALGNAADGFTGTVTLTSGDAAAVLPAAHAFVAADKGSYTFLGLKLATSGSQTLTATSAGLNDAASVSVLAGDATSLVITIAPTSVVAGQPFSVTFEFRDASGNLASDDDRAIVVSGPDGELRTLDANTASVVVSNIVLTDASAATTITVSATDLGLSDTAAIAVTAGPASKLVVTGPAAAIAGTPFSVTVAAHDQYDNVAADYRGVVRFSSNDPSTDPVPVMPGDYTFTSADAGSHTFTDALTLRTSSPTAIRVTVTDLTPIAAPTATLDVTVGGGPAVRIALTGPSTIAAGAPFEVTATVYDAVGNVATGYTGTVAFSSTNIAGRPVPDLPSNYTFLAAEGGRHTFTGTERVTLFGAGDLVVTVTDQTPIATPAANLPVRVTPGPAAGLSVTRTGTTNVPAGTSFSLTVSALDAYGNVATNYLGRVVFTTDDTHTAPAPVLPAAYQFVAGDGGGKLFPTVTLYTAGPRTVTATDQTPIATPAGVLSLTVDGGVASKLRFAQQPTNGVAGVALAPSVTVEVADAYDNRASTAVNVIDIGIATNPGRAVATGVQATAVAGSATFASLSLDRPGVSYVLRATTAGLSAGLSSAFTVAWQAPTVTAPTVVQTGNCVDVSYSTSHNLARPVDVKVEYDLTNDDPDLGWKVATQCGSDPVSGISGVNGLHTTTTAAANSFRWNALKDLGAFDAVPVSVRVTTSLDGVSTTSAATAQTFDASWTGTWKPSAHSGNPVASAVGDVDADGHPDLVTVEANTNLFFYEKGDGKGGFGTPVPFNIDISGMNPIAVDVARTTKRYDASEGLPDVIITDAGADRVIVAHMALNANSGAAELGDFAVIDTPCGGNGPWVSDVEVANAPTYYSVKRLYLACPATKKVVGYAWSGQQWDLQETIDTAAYGAPRSLASADLDWNGKADLAIGLDAGGVLLYGAPISVDYQPFFQLIAVPSLLSVTDIAIGDLDRDGSQDIVFIDSNPAAKRVLMLFGGVLRDPNESVTRLANPAALAAPGTPDVPTSIALVDIDRDGWLDVVVGSLAGDSVAVLRSNSFRNGSATVDRVATGATFDGPNALSLSDLNHDGWTDIAVSRRSVVGTRRIGAVLGTPRADCDNTWAGASDAPTFNYPLGETLVSDVDGDGRNDLVHALANGGEGGVAIAYGRGNGRYNADEDVVVATNNSTVSASLGDLDSDGDVDVALVDNGQIAVFKQTNRYAWVAATGLTALPKASGPVIVADVDNDRRDDLVWLEVDPQLGTSTIHIFLQTSTGTFVAATTGALAIGTNAVGLSLADVNLDGTLDFAFTTFRPTQTAASLCTLLSTAASTWPATLADTNCTLLREGAQDLYVQGLPGFVNVDADPAPELVVEVTGANQQNTIQIRSASTAGLYDQVEDDGAPATLPSGYRLCEGGGDPVFGSFGGDGVTGKDMALRCQSSPMLATFRRFEDHFDKSPNWQDGQYLFRGSLAAGDMNGDHLADLVNGATTFPQGSRATTHAYGSDTASSYDVTAVDLDGNGFDDLAGIASATPTLFVTRQAAGAGGKFGKPFGVLLANDPISSAVAGDFDADGRPDLAMTYYLSGTNNGLFIATQDNGYLGQSFYESQYPTDQLTSVQFTHPVVGDFEANGFDDVAIAVSDANGGIFVRFINQYSPGNFATWTSSTALQSLSDLAAGRLRKPTADNAQSDAVALAGTCGQTSRPCIAIVNVASCQIAPCDVIQLFPKNPDSIIAIAVGDLNRDGLDDIAIAQSDSDDYPTVFLQTAAGSFSEYFPAGNAAMFKGRATSLAIVDVDRDGYGDLVARTASYTGDYRMDSVEVILNGGTALFALSTANRIESFGYVAQTLLVGDLARTGRPALAGANTEGDLLRIKN